ncbi:hypothetical protein [Paenibacillus sp. FSL P2-0136]|uniref:hypothetical protein n=1 Tax=Paenibacillus sp. FSL P2-0136 TaxID=2975317 RepID=UPI0030DAEE69
MHSYTVSQRFFGPVAGVIIAVLILYSYKPNPVMSSYSATAVFLFIACAWLGLSFLNHEQAVQKQVVIVQSAVPAATVSAVCLQWSCLRCCWM